MTFARVLTGSGLTKVELGLLYGVSRRTVHTWATVGPPRAGSYTARMAQVITQALVNAMDRKILPFKPIRKDARFERVMKMAVTVQSLKPAPIRG